MRGVSWVGVEEGSALLQEVVELSVLPARAGVLVDEPSCGSGGLQQDLSELIQGQLLSRA